jgi:hypothetical protein
LGAEVLEAQWMEHQLGLLAVVAALGVAVAAVVKMPSLEAVAVMAQYLFGLGSLINDNMY